MHKTAIDFAIAHKISLGRFLSGGLNGYYYIANTDEVSYYPTAKSAVVMMKRYLRRANSG